MTEKTLLRVNQLSAGYGEAVVLQHISFELNEGETLALLGRNGTGKTSLLDTLVGATRQHHGEIVFASQNFNRLPSYKRAEAGLGWVPQERNIFKSLTVHENLTAVARLTSHHLNGAPWTPDRVYQLFPRLAERKLNLGAQLSGGEQQMLAVGRALVTNPRLLLLDEPLEGLAPIIVQELLKAITHITRKEGLSAIIVEQHPQAILSISDRALVLDHGEVVHYSSAQDLANAPQLLNQFLGVSSRTS